MCDCEQKNNNYLIFRSRHCSDRGACGRRQALLATSIADVGGARHRRKRRATRLSRLTRRSPIWCVCVYCMCVCMYIYIYICVCVCLLRNQSK